MSNVKTSRILSTAGISLRNSASIRSYCNLMQRSLADKWLFADDFVESHVCLIGGEYLANLDKAQTSKFQVIVMVNETLDARAETDNSDNKRYQYVLSAPFTASKIRALLNTISDEVDFKALHEKTSESDEESEHGMDMFKATFSKIRGKLFGAAEKETREFAQSTRFQFIKNITKKLQPETKLPVTMVLLGSPGSGKTTAIQSAASDGIVLNSDVSATDSVANDKAKTTVGIDYATIDIGEESKVKLFGTPGQVKFNYVWDMAGKNADAFIILLDMSRPEPLSYLKFYKDFLADEFSGVTQVYCALTHCHVYKGDINLVKTIINSKFTDLKNIHELEGRGQDSVLSMIKDIYSRVEMEKQKKSINHFTSTESFGVRASAS